MLQSRRFLRLNGAAAAIGILVGLAVVGFRYAINFVEHFAFHPTWNVVQVAAASTAAETNRFIASPLGIFVALVPAVGGLAVGLIRVLRPDTKQQGIAEVMAAVQAQGGVLRARTSLGHALISAITVGTGGSTGREGPISYIGAAVGSSIARRLGFNSRDLKVLLGCGFAAGIGATFNAPLGGTILALELIVPEFSTHAFIPLVVSAVVGTAVARWFFTEGGAVLATFQVPAFHFTSPFELVAYLVLGIACGLGAVVFLKLLSGMSGWWRRSSLPAWAKPMLGGLAVGIIGLTTLWLTDAATAGLPGGPRGQYHVFGSGYSSISDILNGGATSLLGPLLVIAIAKPLATSLTIGSGGGGGIFTASLLMGAAWGGLVGLIARFLFPGAGLDVASYALVGMGAFYAATARATLTSIVILCEITGSFAVTLPVMFAAVTADAVSVALSPESAYTIRLAEKGILYEHDRLQSPLDMMRVRDVMTKEVATLPATMTAGDAFNTMLDRGHTGYPFVDAEGLLVGVVTRRDLSRQLQEGQGQVRLLDAIRKPPLTATPEEVLHRARDRMTDAKVGRLIIVDPLRPRHILGILTRSDILKAEAERDVGGPDAFDAGHIDEVTA